MIRRHLKNSSFQLAGSTLKNSRVDNLLLTFSNVREAIDAYKGPKRAFNEACTNIRAFFSNSQAVDKATPEEDRQEDSEVHPSVSMKALSILWKPKQDQLLLEIEGPLKGLDTKRILSLLSAIYDLLGLMHKLPLQELWKAGYEWGDQIDPAHAEQTWKQTKILQFIKQMKKRIASDDDNPKFLALVDTSTKAYAVVVYLKQIG